MSIKIEVRVQKRNLLNTEQKEFYLAETVAMYVSRLPTVGEYILPKEEGPYIVRSVLHYNCIDEQDLAGSVTVRELC